MEYRRLNANADAPDAVHIARDGNPEDVEAEAADAAKPEIELTEGQNNEDAEDEYIPFCSLRVWKKAFYFFIVNGGVDVQPADENQCQVNQDGHPIDVL